ncbi:Rrf2 family transcriptional regulator [bacterium]|nr:Rrf2 family transcriptional regulator [bacterium]
MFSVSQKSKYGLRAVYELANRYQEGPLKAHQIADAHDIPLKYLEKVLQDLKQAGIVQSQRGAYGGYILAKSPQDLTIGSIVYALEGPLDLAGDLDGELHFFWKRFELDVQVMLEKTVQELVADKQKAEHVVTYSI